MQLSHAIPTAVLAIKLDIFKYDSQEFNEVPSSYTYVCNADGDCTITGIH